MANEILDKNGRDKLEDKTNESNQAWRTCDYWSLPQWLQDNNYIFKHYRPPLPLFIVCFCSIFRIHTETINIWTHLLGCLLFIVLFLHMSISSLLLEDKIVLSPFFVGAIVCLGFSSTFHTVLCHSQTVKSVFNRLDFCGITILIVGSFVPWLYYAFYCNGRLQILYLVGIVSLGICATVFSLSKTFRQPQFRPVRATMFVVFGLSGVIPSVHFILIEGWDAFVSFGTPLIIAAFFYILGAVFYTIRVPERIFPGKCDIVFQSHQFFHVLVVVATLINYIGLTRIAWFAEFRRSSSDFCLEKPFYYRQFSTRAFN